MLVIKLENWEFRYIQLSAEKIILQGSFTNMWACNLAIAVMNCPDNTLPNEIYHHVESMLLRNGFFGWGIIKDGQVTGTNKTRIAQPYEVEGVPENALFTISVDYKLLEGES